MLSQRVPSQDSSQSNERINKRKKIGGNTITEGDVHDYILEDRKKDSTKEIREEKIKKVIQ